MRFFAVSLYLVLFNSNVSLFDNITYCSMGFLESMDSAKKFSLYFVIAVIHIFV